MFLTSECGLAIIISMIYVDFLPLKGTAYEMLVTVLLQLITRKIMHCEIKFYQLFPTFHITSDFIISLLLIGQNGQHSLSAYYCSVPTVSICRQKLKAFSDVIPGVGHN